MSKRTLFLLFTAVSVLVAVFSGIYLLVAGGHISSDALKQNEHLFKIASAILGAFWAVLGILSISRQESASTPSAPFSSERPFFKEPHQFINRIDNIRSLLEEISKYKIVSVFGQKGVGKSELLKYFCDIARRNPSVNFLPSDLQKECYWNLPKTAFYVDLVDTIGWENTVRQISLVLTGEKLESVLEIAVKVDGSQGKNGALIFLDNVNNVATAQSILNNISNYSHQRPQDFFILGSVSRLIDLHMSIGSVEVKPLAKEHCRMFLEAKGLHLAGSELASAISQSSGLPLFLNFIALYQRSCGQEKEPFNRYFISEVYSRLGDDDRELLVFISVCNIVLTSLSIAELSNAGFAALDSRLQRLRQYSTTITTATGLGPEIKVHDLVRDIILDANKTVIPDMAKRSALFLRKINRLAMAVPFALSSGFSQEECDEVCRVVDEQTQKANFPFLLSFWENAEQWAGERSMFHQSLELRRKAIYGYVLALLGTGSYHKAEKIVQSSALSELRVVRPNDIRTQFDFDVQYALIDLDHLLNRYELAREHLLFLIGKSREQLWANREGKGLWLYAHLTGHIGDDLVGALETYDACIEKAKACGDELLYLRARNGQIALNFTLGRDSSETLGELQGLIETVEDLEGNGAVRSALYRNLSRYYRLMGDHKSALEAIEKSLEIARENGLRTTINCDFSKGEICRFRGDYEEAVGHYKDVIDATEMNGDSNLLTSALLASLICDIQNGEPIYAESLDNVESHIAYVEEIAKNKGMQITQIRAGIVRLAWAFSAGMSITESKAELKKVLYAIGLERDLSILETLPDQLRYLEIHVH